MPISDDPARFSVGAELVHADGRRLRIASARTHNHRLLIHFEGVESRDDAKSMRRALFVTPEDLRALGEAEYWEHEVVGCVVWGVDGTRIGDVVRLTPAPAQDLLVVATEKGERLIPLVNEIVKEVDVGAGRIVADPPEGLLD